MVKLQLTVRGKALVKNAPDVVQGLLVSGLEHLSDKKLATIGDGLSVLVDILGVKSVPPKLIGSREVNVPRKRIRHSLKGRSRIKRPERNKKKKIIVNGGKMERIQPNPAGKPFFGWSEPVAKAALCLLVLFALQACTPAVYQIQLKIHTAGEGHVSGPAGCQDNRRPF